jgi:hypothetical protein
VFLKFTWTKDIFQKYASKFIHINCIRRARIWLNYWLFQYLEHLNQAKCQISSNWCIYKTYTHEACTHKAYTHKHMLTKRTPVLTKRILTKRIFMKLILAQCILSVNVYSTKCIQVFPDFQSLQQWFLV